MCLLFRRFNPNGYFGDDDIYFAIYLRELTSLNLSKKICQKMCINHDKLASILVLQQTYATIPLSDDLVKTLKFEQTLEIEIEAASQSEPWSEPDISVMKIRIQ